MSVDYYIILSIILFFIGNIIRAYRTLYILSPYLNKPIKPYFKSAFIGFIIDFLLPFKISNIVRIFIFSRLTKSSYRMSLSLAFIEMVFDLIMVFLILLFFNIKSISILIMFTMATLLFIFCDFIILKKIYYYCVSIFNDFIKSFLLGLYWSLYRFRIDIINNNKKLFIFSLSSLLMWTFNILSVIAISNVILNVNLKDLLLYQFTDLTPVGIIKYLSIFKGNDLINYILYLVIPNIILVLIAYIPFKEKDKKEFLKMLPYVSNDISMPFFKYYFNNIYSKNDETYYNMINNATIIKDLSATSEAKTYLMQGKENLFVRKIALSNASDKLKLQYEWIKKNKCLPLPKIINKVEEEKLFSYDMEYFANGGNFFTTIHYFSIERSCEILNKILTSLDKTYNNINNENKYYNTLFYKKYIEENINISISNTEIKNLLEYETLIVNNEKVPNILKLNKELEEFNNSLEYDIKYIHGDLTIENILVDSNLNYIIIDPSPMYNNIFSEYAKLFQSLHGKYEYIKNSKSWNINKNIIKYADYSTKKYEDIFNYIKKYILNNHGIQGLKATYFYEAICHLRTLSYMVRLKKENAILMLALAGLALFEWRKL